MKILVTGAAGFIGCNLAARLVNSGHEVLGIDNFDPYYSPELKELRVRETLGHLGTAIERVDLTNFGNVHSIVKSFHPESIIHLAGQPGVRTPLINSDRYIQNNLVAFTNILQAAVQLDVPNFLYASSSSVYGNATELPYREDNKSVDPISIYGATKLANEFLAKVYVSGSLTRARGLRFFTVYGPWGRPDMAYFRVIDAALNGSKFTRFGEGEVKRDFTFVEDISRFIESLNLQLRTCSPGFSDIVNIGGGKPQSLNDLIKEISTQLSSSVRIIDEISNPLDTKITSADVLKLLNLTGGKPEIDLHEGVKKLFPGQANLEFASGCSAGVTLHFSFRAN